jgi:hypothetical protein
VTVGCPAIDLTTAVPPSLSACCGPFTDMSGVLLANLGVVLKAMEQLVLVSQLTMEAMILRAGSAAPG